MKYKSILCLSAFIGITSISKAQENVEFYINGYGRSIITSNALETSSVKENQVGGYNLFDLKPSIKLGKNLWANSILRIRSPFGGFFGTGTSFYFRQFQMGGSFGKYFNFDLGDINVGEGMSPFTVNNFDDFYTRFESDIYTQRRNILTYENFNYGNLWRLQGAQGRSKFSVGNILDTVSAYGFVARTQISKIDNIDRILGGGRLAVNYKNMVKIGGNYVGLFDIPVSFPDQIYKNNVFTTDINLDLKLNDDMFLNLNTDFGKSNFTNSIKSLNKDTACKDFYYQAGFKFDFKPSKLKLSGSYKNVGAIFTSPTAQTRRINNTTGANNALFTSVNGSSRSNGLFDRFANESGYNRVILPTFQQYNPIYSNIFPYGAATPNRKGITLGIQTDTSAKIVNAEFSFDSYSQIFGENDDLTSLKKYLGLKGGMSIDFGKFLGYNKNFILQGGIRTEKTTRAGFAPVDLQSSIVDLGLSIEVIKNVDIMLGQKALSAKGNEYMSIYNVFNVISEKPIEFKDININDKITSFGMRYRMSKSSHVSVNYNMTNFDFKTISQQNYKLNQLFMNFTISL